MRKAFVFAAWSLIGGGCAWLTVVRTHISHHGNRKHYARAFSHAHGGFLYANDQKPIGLDLQKYSADGLQAQTVIEMIIELNYRTNALINKVPKDTRRSDSYCGLLGFVVATA
ncbi:MAG: hypothetical protein ACLQAR_07100 [Steroidobacteraceae bacterium]